MVKVEINRDKISINESRLEKFVLDHNNGNIFQIPELHKVFQKTRNYTPYIFYLEDDNSNEILGVLCCVIIQEIGLAGFFSSRCIIWGGPIVKNNETLLVELLLQSFIKKIKNEAIFVQFRNIYDISSNHLIFIKHGFNYEAHLDIIIDLTKKWEVLKKDIHKSRHRNFTKASNKGSVFQEISKEDEIIEGYTVIQNTYSRIRLPFPDISHFISLFQYLKRNSYVHFFSAKVNDKIIGIRVVLTYKDVIYDYYAGSSIEYKNYYPNDFLILHILKWGLEHKFKYFDFGGAGKPEVPYSVRDYKLQFGGKLVDYGRYVKINKPMLYFIGKVGVKVLGWVRSFF